MAYRLSEDAMFTLIETTDVGGTTAATGWVSMENFDRAMAYVEIGTWDATDDLDHCRIEAATTSAGASSSEVTTDAAAGDYDTNNPVDADGDFVIIEIRSQDLPAGKPWIRLVVGEDGNTGVDNVTALLIRYAAHYKRKELNGAAATGSKVYVDPQIA